MLELDLTSRRIGLPLGRIGASLGVEDPLGILKIRANWLPSYPKIRFACICSEIGQVHLLDADS